MYTETPWLPGLPDSQDRNFFDTIEDSWKLSPPNDVARVLTAPQFKDDPSFDPFAEGEYGRLSPAYAPYIDQFAHARSAAEFDYIKANIDENNSTRAGLNQDPWYQQLAGGAVAALGDPTTYIAMPLSRGIGVARAAFRTGTALGTITAAGQGVSLALNPNKTIEESTQIVAGSVIIGGVLGGIVGRGAPNLIGGSQQSTLTAFANDYFARHSDAEGLPIIRSVDLNGQLAPVELGTIPPVGGNQLFYQWLPATPATATSAATVERVLLDEAAIHLSFNNRPWTMGANPLPADAFSSPREWTNFIVHRSMQEKINPRIVNETLDAYDGRLNVEAYRNVLSAREPLNALSAGLLKTMQPGSPTATALSLFGKDPYLFDVFLRIGGDFGTLNQGNLAGKPTPHSVLLRIGVEKGQRLYDMNLMIQQQYAKYQTGTLPTGSRVMTGIKNAIVNAPFVGGRLRNGKLDRVSFNKLVAVATENPGLASYKGEIITPEMHEVAAFMRKTLDGIDEYARVNGLYEDITTVSTQIGRLGAVLDKKQNFLQSVIDKIAVTTGARKLSNLNVLLNRTNLEITDIAQQLTTAETRLAQMKSTPRTPTGAAAYLPHVVNVAAVRADRARFESIAEGIFLRDGNLNPRQAAIEYTKSILGEIPQPTSVGVSQASYLKKRELNGSVLELGDFLELDINLVMTSYLNKVVPALEMAKMFGDYRMSAQMDEVRQYLNLKLLNEPDKLRAQNTYDDTLQLMEDMRDRVLGTYGVHEPLELTARAAKNVKLAASLSYMGQVLFSAITDASRVAGTLGKNNVFQGFAAYLSHDLQALKVQQRYAPAVGEAMDIIQGSTIQRFVGGSESILRSDGGMVSKFLEGAQGPFYNATGLSAWTVGLKQFSSLVGSHVIIKDSIAVAKKITAGLEPDNKLVVSLAKFGIGRDDALLIAKMPHQLTSNGKLHLANIAAWTGQEGELAKSKFLNALAGRIRQSVTTPGPMDRPAILDGVITKRSTRRKIEQGMNMLKADIEGLRSQMKSLAPQQGVPAIRQQMDALAAEIQEKRVQIGQMQGSQAAQSRGGSPVLSLPTQFMAFPFAFASKMMQSTATGQEKSAVTGMLTLFGFAYLSNWLRTPSYSWDKQSVTEKTYNAFSRSGIAGWLESPGRIADIMLEVGPKSLLGIENKFGPPGIPEMIGGVAGPGPGLVANLFDGVFNPQYNGTDRFGVFRRNLPFTNHLLVKPLLKYLEDEVVVPVFGKSTARQRRNVNSLDDLGASSYDSYGYEGSTYPNKWVSSDPIDRTLPPTKPLPPLSAAAAAPPTQQMLSPDIPGAPFEPPVEPAPAMEMPVETTAPVTEVPMDTATQPEQAVSPTDQPTEPPPARLTMPMPEGNPGARDQTVWALSKESRQDFVNSFVAAAATATQATASAEASGSGGPATDTQPMDATDDIDLSGPFEDTATSSNPQNGLMWIKKNSQNEGYRKLASAILENGLGKTRVVIAMTNPNYAGLTTFESDGTSEVSLNGKDGMDEETFLHELLHAYTQQRWMSLSAYNQRNKQIVGDTVDRNDATVQEFRDIWRKISTNITRNADPEYVKNNIALSEFIASPGEGLSYVMTNPSLKDYLKTIDVNGEDITPESGATETMFDTFAGWLAKSLNLPPTEPTRSALDEIMSKGNNLIDAGKFVKPDGEFGLKVYLDTARKTGTLPKP